MKQAEDRGAGVDASPPSSGGAAEGGLQQRVLSQVERLKAEAKGRKEEVQRLAKEAKAFAKAARGLSPLSRPAAWKDPWKLHPLLAKLEKRLDAGERSLTGADAVLRALRDFADDLPRRMREEVGKGIQEACRARGLPFSVVRRDPPVEVRIAPFAVVLDFEKGKAELRFARERLAVCPATLEQVLEAHRRALRAFGEAFDPAAFFRSCRKAYLLALAERGGKDGDRVEILDLLPLLALQQQSRKFRADPTSANFKSYPRARFAYDVLRLMRAGGLSRDGLRLNLGVATGGTAHEKSRVVFIEDEQGRGEFKLTVFFTPAEEGAGP